MSTAKEHDAPVASLNFFHSSRTSKPQYMYGNDEFDVGRKHIRRLFGVEDYTVSAHHLRFHCVVFDDGQDPESSHVAPLVYARVLSSNAVILRRSSSNNSRDITTLTRDSGDVLLNHDDALQLTPTTSIVFRAEDYGAADANGLTEIQQAEAQRFVQQYEVTGRVLGSGGNASVFVAIKQSTKRQFACKIIDMPPNDATSVDGKLRPAEARELEQRQQKKRETLAREYNVLKDLSHPNIISLEKVFCATHHIYIFQELITGGDLLSYMDQAEALSEPEAAVISRQILKAVEYLHGNGIVHRDIKPENILMTSWRQGARIVLTDFGQSRTLEDAKSAARTTAVFRMQSVCGTYGYTAPEVYKQLKRDLQHEGYSKAIDIWSIGCITGALLTSEVMFNDNGEEDTNSQHWSLDFLNTSASWRSIGRKAKSFIRGCLELDEAKRLTAKQALLHEWFTNKHYAAELEAAYQRAIADWKPRAQSGKLIEFIDTRNGTAAQQQRTKPVPDSTKSRHFAPQASVYPPPVSLSFKQMSLPPSKKKHTPLSTIAEDARAEQTTSWRPLAPDLYASPMRVPDTPPPVEQPMPASLEDLSIRQYLPPETLAQDSQYAAPVITDETDDGVTQSQVMLDDFSLPKLPPTQYTMATVNGDAGQKRDSGFRAGGGSIGDSTQCSGDFDLPLPPQKRPCY